MSEEQINELIQYNLDYSIEEDLEETKKCLKEANKEIERLNNRVKQLEKSIMISNKIHSFRTKDNIKLRTIIIELEKEIKWQRKICLSLNNYGVSVCDILLNKLKELKGDDK